MSEDERPARLSRRRILAGVAATAGLGAVGGAGTRAVLRDTETVPGSVLGNPYEGTRVDLELSCGETGDVCTVQADGVSFAFENVGPGSSDSVEVCPGLDEASEPAWLWFRTTTPTEASLAEEVTVTLAFGDGTPVVDPSGEPVAGRSLDGLLEAFADGGAIPGEGPDGTFATGENRCLELSWSLPDDPTLSGRSIAFGMRFAAVQYRVDTGPNNPWQS
jgi:hypothetical protein